MAYWDGPSGYWFQATCACLKFTAKPKFRCETPVLGAEHLEEFHWMLMLHIHNADLYYGKNCGRYTSDTKLTDEQITCYPSCDGARVVDWKHGLVEVIEDDRVDEGLTWYKEARASNVEGPKPKTNVVHQVWKKPKLDVAYQRGMEDLDTKMWRDLYKELCLLDPETPPKNKRRVRRRMDEDP